MTFESNIYFVLGFFFGFLFGLTIITQVYDSKLMKLIQEVFDFKEQLSHQKRKQSKRK